MATRAGKKNERKKKSTLQAGFVVTDKQWLQIVRSLNKPARVLPKLKKQLSKPDDWDIVA